MKYARMPHSGNQIWSLPVRGAWIEMPFPLVFERSQRGRSPCGERGLKYLVKNDRMNADSRSPCGERGLKLYHVIDCKQ